MDIQFCASWYKKLSWGTDDKLFVLLSTHQNDSGEQKTSRMLYNREIQFTSAQLMSIKVEQNSIPDKLFGK